MKECSVNIISSVCVEHMKLEKMVLTGHFILLSPFGVVMSHYKGHSC